MRRKHADLLENGPDLCSSNNLEVPDELATTVAKRDTVLTSAPLVAPEVVLHGEYMFGARRLL